MEGEDYENKKDNLQSASGMPGIFRHILWQSKCICRSETGIVGNGDTAETGKDCVVQVEAKNSGADFPERCGWCFPVQTTPEAAHLNSA